MSFPGLQGTQSAERRVLEYRALCALRFALYAILAFALAGCGGPVPVQGTVTLNGKPLAGAMVVFIPEGGGEEAGDITNEEGTFQLKGRKVEGILPGEYRVTVSKKDWPSGVPPADMRTASFVQKRETVPHKYTVQDKTPFHVTVTKAGASDIHLDLEK